MEKIKLNKEIKLKNKIVKFNNEKIEIKPYIDTDDLFEISSLVLGNYYDDHKSEDSITQTMVISSFKIVYSYILAVTNIMTNIECDDINVIMNSGLVEILEQNIKNYKEVLESLYFTIEQKNKYELESKFESYIDEMIYEVKHILDNKNEELDNTGKEMIKSLEELELLQKNGLPKENKTEAKTEKKTVKKTTKKTK